MFSGSLTVSGSILLEKLRYKILFQYIQPRSNMTRHARRREFYSNIDILVVQASILPGIF